MPKQLRLPGAAPPMTQVERLLVILSDHHWHATKELARRIGHTFHVAIFVARQNYYVVERRRHPTTAYQHEYRLVKNRY